MVFWIQRNGFGNYPQNEDGLILTPCRKYLYYTIIIHSKTFI